MYFYYIIEKKKYIYLLECDDNQKSNHKSTQVGSRNCCTILNCTDD